MGKLIMQAEAAIALAAVVYVFGAFVAWSPWPGDWWAVWRWIIASFGVLAALIGWILADDL